MVQIRAMQERGTFNFGRAGDSGVRDNAVLKTRLRQETDEIHSSPAGELLTECGMSPLQYSRRTGHEKTLCLASQSPRFRSEGNHPGTVDGWRRGSLGGNSQVRLHESGG